MAASDSTFLFRVRSVASAVDRSSATGHPGLTFTSTGPVPNFVPGRILDIPFLFRDKAHARAVLDSPIGQEMLAKFEAKGFQGAGLGRAAACAI